MSKERFRSRHETDELREFRRRRIERRLQKEGVRIDGLNRAKIETIEDIGRALEMFENLGAIPRERSKD